MNDGEEISYDYLVLAGGATVNYFGTPGAAEHAFPLYTLMNAVRLRNRVMERFEAAAGDPTVINDGALNFVVVGAGPTGVGNGRRTRQISSTTCSRMIITNWQPTRLESLSSRWEKRCSLSSRRTYESTPDRSLRNAGLNCVSAKLWLRLGQHSSDSNLAKKSRLHTLIWAAVCRANPLAHLLGMPQGRGGRVKLNPDLSVPDHPEIFVVGDMGEVASEGKLLPQLGSVAMQSGDHVGRQIARRIAGEETQAFKYWDKGFMATIGRGSAVVEFPNQRTLHGPLAYFAWLGVHLALLNGTRNRIETLWNWGWSALTHDRAARIIMESDDETQGVTQSGAGAAAPVRGRGDLGASS